MSSTLNCPVKVCIKHNLFFKNSLWGGRRSKLFLRHLEKVSCGPAKIKKYITLLLLLLFVVVVYALRHVLSCNDYIRWNKALLMSTAVWTDHISSGKLSSRLSIYWTVNKVYFERLLNVTFNFQKIHSDKCYWLKTLLKHTTCNTASWFSKDTQIRPAVPYSPVVTSFSLQADKFHQQGETKKQITVRKCL